MLDMYDIGYLGVKCDKDNKGDMIIWVTDMNEGYSMNDMEDMGDISDTDGFTLALFRSLRFI